MTDLGQILISGVLLGGIYALAAFGLSLCFGVLGVLNVAHGEFLMLGALGGYWAHALTGANPFLVTLLIAPAFFVVGVAFERLLLRRIPTRTRADFLVASIIVTLGAALAIEDTTAFVTREPYTSMAYSLPSVTLFGIVIPLLRLFVFGFIVLLTVAIQLFLTRTPAGMGIRAIAQNRRGAEIVGLNIPRLSGLTFGIGAALAAVAGVFWVVQYSANPFMGLPLTIKYLAIVVLGGLGSLIGALLGGIILGVTETVVGLYAGAHWSPALAYLALVAILLIRPQGLFGRATGAP